MVVPVCRSVLDFLFAASPCGYPGAECYCRHDSSQLWLIPYFLSLRPEVRHRKFDEAAEFWGHAAVGGIKDMHRTRRGAVFGQQGEQLPGGEIGFDDFEGLQQDADAGDT